MKPKILITDRFAPDALQRLQGDGRFDIVQGCDPFHQPAQYLADAHALMIRSRTRIDAALLARAPQLRVIVTCTSGFDHIDLAATAQRGISVMFTPGANAASAAQLTWALILSCANAIPRADAGLREGGWSRESLVGIELAERCIGIVGLGRIGIRVARIAQAFGMQVLACDPFIDAAVFHQHDAEAVELDELLQRSHVISFHVPRTAQTRAMLDRARFAQLRPDAILVNTSRGGVFDEADLCHALQHGQLHAAGLDVFSHEPLPPDSPLRRQPGVVLSPHIGAYTEAAFSKASNETADKLLAFFNTGEIRDRLPPEAAWYRG
ncbi:MAG: hydroxyacid dehydrogenase [Gammaproteobacteria bacterium]|nr:hydroxyacid dehydrogenase [Gammaproteobacteria bacterium]